MSLSRTAIVTDSTADIPAAEARRLGIRIVPALITVEEQTHEDNESFDRAAFYNQLRNYPIVPTTAAPSLAAFTSVYEELLQEGYERIISLHVSSKLSSLCDIAVSAARGFANRVYVFDSGQLSLGLGFQVMEAALEARAGTPFNSILNLLPEVQKRIRVLAMINKLDYLRRSGRVNWAAASIGTWLQVKMVVGLKDGMVHRLAAVRTRARALRDMSSRARDWGPIQRLAVLHTGIAEEAGSFARSLESYSSGIPMIIDATTVIGTHIGEGSIGIAALV